MFYRRSLLLFLIGLSAISSVIFYQKYTKTNDIDTPSFSILSHRDVSVDKSRLEKRLSELSVDKLEAMYKAGLEIQKWESLLAKTNSTVVTEVLKGQEFTHDGEHFPHEDVFDSDSNSQYFYHSHRDGEHGHFHVYLWRDAMDKSIVPLVSKEDVKDAVVNDNAHLIAISMDDEGVPIKLFTVNRWVSSDTWYSSEDILKICNQFEINHTQPSWPTNQWLKAMITFFGPQIEDLLKDRDQKIVQLKEQFPSENILENRDIELLSEEFISFDTQLELVISVLGQKKEP